MGFFFLGLARKASYVPARCVISASQSSNGPGNSTCRLAPSAALTNTNRPSAVFLDYTYDLLCQHDWKIGNIDATIVAERPKLAPYLQAMRAHLAEHLSLSIEQVSVKATTTDGLGFAGRREGIPLSRG